MNKVKIKLSYLKNLIKEESEQLDEAAKEQSIHAAKAAISSAASKLLSAFEEFKETATPSAMGAVTPHFSELEKILDHMTDAPGAYVSKAKPKFKKVSMKPVT